jgi:voltage-gated potassium channel Kch
MVAGIGGFLRHGDSPVAAVYQTLQMFFLESLDLPTPVPPLIEVARWLAAASTLLAVLKLGGSLFREERTGLRLHRMSGHTILCGLGHKTMRLIEHLRAKGKEVVVIDKAPPADLMQDCRRAHAHVLAGDATDPDILSIAGVKRAQRVFAMCPEDSTNCEIAAQVRRIRSKSHGSTQAQPLSCHVHLSDVDLRSSLQSVFTKGSDTQWPADKESRVSLQFFDLFDLEARRLLREHLPLDGRGITKEDPHQAHLVILGFGRMGRALAVRAAQVGHFANGKRLRISVVDRHAGRHEAALLFRYPRFREVCDLDFHNLEAETPEARGLLEKWCCDKETIPSVAVCFDNEPRALEIALQLQTMLGVCRVPIAIRMARQSGLARLLQRDDSGDADRFSYVRPFGMYEDCCDPKILIEGAEDRLARLLHCDYVEKQRQRGASPATNPVMRDWEDLDEDFRESNRQQAAHLPVKLRAIGCEAAELADPRPAVTAFEPDEVELLAQMEHARWVAERTLAGWTYASGPKDPKRKTSPYLVPWDQVPPDIQQYDRDFVVLIPTLLAADGKKTCRREPSTDRSKEKS